MAKLSVAKFIRYALCCTAFICSVSVFAADDNTQLTKTYIQSFKQEGAESEKKNIAKALQFSGITSPILYDLIAAELRTAYPSANTRSSIDYAAWLCNALAYSGQEKYRATLEEVIASDAHKKLKGYAKKAMPVLNQYKIWNPIITDKSQHLKSLNTNENQVMNMLRSSDLELKRIGAKRVYNQRLFNSNILNWLNEDIKARFADVDNTKIAIDTLAWEMKALASSSQESYKSTIMQIQDTANNRQLKKYAQRYLKYFQQ